MEHKNIKIGGEEFIINKMPVMDNLKLVREIALLFADTKVIKAVVLKKFVLGIFHENSEDVEQEEYLKLTQLDDATIIANLVNSFLFGLNDEATDRIIAKCMKSVRYRNGSQYLDGQEIIDTNVITDIAVLVELLIEVIKFNYGGTLEAIKKLISGRA